MNFDNKGVFVMKKVISMLLLCFLLVSSLSGCEQLNKNSISDNRSEEFSITSEEMENLNPNVSDDMIGKYVVTKVAFFVDTNDENSRRPKEYIWKDIDDVRDEKYQVQKQNGFTKKDLNYKNEIEYYNQICNSYIEIDEKFVYCGNNDFTDSSPCRYMIDNIVDYYFADEESFALSIPYYVKNLGILDENNKLSFKTIVRYVYKSACEHDSENCSYLILPKGSFAYINNEHLQNAILVTDSVNLNFGVILEKEK